MKKKFARVFSAQPKYLDGQIITVEIDVSMGLHRFDIVGMAGRAVDEARSRVGAALKNVGCSSPKHVNHRTIVSLAPAEIRKNGSYFDVAIALGYLLAQDEIMFNPVGKVFLGEVSLDGDIRPVTGVLALTQHARAQGFSEIYVPKANAYEAGFVDGITVYAVSHMRDLLVHLDPTFAGERGRPLTPQPLSDLSAFVHTPPVDMVDIKGQEVAKRALMFAAAGGHNVALYGPPGTGKTMLAQAFRGIMPELTHEQTLEVLKIHSIAGLFQGTFSRTPPLRSPHHSSSAVSIIGGGAIPGPGEITLAHHGILFLDEFPEFDSQVIEALRQPLEDRIINISRAQGQATFPANIILIAAMNPCPCGFYGTKVKKCTCSPFHIERYHKKLSGPIVDRIDIWTPVEHIDYQHFHTTSSPGVSSHDMHTMIVRARARQYERNGKGITNSMLSARMMTQIVLHDDALKTLQKSASILGISPRGYHRMIKLARTIADLENDEVIQERHILEALQYRPKM